MKNYIVIAPWAGYTDMGSVNFVNAISDSTTEWEAERLLTALSGLVIICPDEETAEREVIRGREGLTNEAHAALMAAADATGNPRFDWRSGIPGEQADAGPEGEESGSEGGETDQETPDGENPTSPDADGDPSDEDGGGPDPDENDPPESSAEDDEDEEDEG